MQGEEVNPSLGRLPAYLLLLSNLEARPRCKTSQRSETLVPL